MYCKNCGQLLNDNQAICLNCGVQKGSGNAFCANCGQPMNPNQAICLNCGVAVSNASADNLAGKDKMTLIIICLFLGGLGIHNFMMGETKKGIMKIVLSLCFGLGAIFALIDLVKIATDKYVVDPEKLF